MLRNTLAFAISIAFTLIVLGARSWAQSGPTFVQLGRAKGALYKPDSGPEPHVGIIVMASRSKLYEPCRLRRICQERFHGSLHELAV